MNLTAIIIGALAAWLILSGMVALYGQDKGFPFFPLFVAALFLGFPLVLLGVVLASGPQPPRRRKPYAEPAVYRRETVRDVQTPRFVR